MKIKKFYDDVEDLLFDYLGEYQYQNGQVVPAIGLAPETRQAEVRGLELIIHPPTINKDLRVSQLEMLSYTWLVELYQHPGRDTIQESVELLVRELGDRCEATPVYDHRYQPSIRSYSVKLLFEVLSCGSC